LDDLATAAAARLVAQIVQLQSTQERVNIGLSEGGRLMWAAALHVEGLSQVDPERLDLWWTHDAFVHPNNSERVSTSTLALLGSVVPFRTASVHPIPSRAGMSDVDAAALAYEQEFGDTVLDICLLGMGTEGRVASLFPDSPAFREQFVSNRCVIPVHDDESPTKNERITMTLRALNRSRQVWLFAFGEGLAAPVMRAFSGDRTQPATHVAGTERTEWILDETAAGELPYYRCDL
jgi:6-phosphogluconolactonase